MANVNFKRGHHANLMAMQSYVEGTFYLTDDTNRLYFAQTNSNLVDLNQYIHIWDGVALPNTTTVPTLEAGDIYYWSSENALIICDDPTNNDWTQLNPDTYLVDNRLTTVQVTDGSVTGSKAVVTTVKDSRNHQASGSFELVPGNANTTITSSGNSITITTANDDTIDTYALGTQASGANDYGIIALTPTHNGVTQTAQTITLTGSGTTSVESDANGNITISSAGGVRAVNQYFQTNGNLDTVVSLSVGGTLPATTVTPQITYGENGTSTAKFNAAAANSATGTAALDVYTTGEVDQKIADALGAADALTYMGALYQADAASTLVATADVGEVYKAAEDIELNGLVHVDPNLAGTAHTGDLIISTGTQDGQVTWEVIPSGNDQLISVDLSSSDNRFIIKDNGTGIGAANFAEGNHIGISTSINTSTRTKTYTFSHLTAGTGTAITPAAVVEAYDSNDQLVANRTELEPATSVATSIDIPVVTSVSLDAYGHVSAATAKTYRICDTHGTLSGLANSVSVTNNNIATIATSMRFDNILSSTGNNSFKIHTTNDSIKLTAEDTNTLKLELVWGTF